MARQLVITGIGTDVGKTIVSAIVCETLHADYWKPIQAGDLNNSDSLKIESLTSNTDIHQESFKLNTPMSPHESAHIDGVKMTISDLKIPKTDNDLVIELAGGLMVPVNDSEIFIDFVSENDLEVILVCSYYLGSINHSLLSLEVLKSRKIKISGLIFNGKKVPSTFDIITKHTSAPVLLEIDQETEITSAVIQNYAKKLITTWK